MRTTIAVLWLSLTLFFASREPRRRKSGCPYDGRP